MKCKFFKEYPYFFILFTVVIYYSLLILIKDVYIGYKTIDNPSSELINNIEQQYLSEKLVNDFEIYNLSTSNCNDDLKIKNSQNIEINSDGFVNFDNEVVIPLDKLPKESMLLLQGLYKAKKENCISIKEKDRYLIK